MLMISRMFVRASKQLKGAPHKFSAENNMDPGSVPAELNDLTQCEEIQIARAFPVKQEVYVRKGYDTISFKVQVFTLPHNVQNIVYTLP